jgi:hypothetical protein
VKLCRSPPNYYSGWAVHAAVGGCVACLPPARGGVRGCGKDLEKSRVMQVDVLQIYCIKIAFMCVDWQAPKQPPLLSGG